MDDNGAFVLSITIQCVLLIGGWFMCRLFGWRVFFWPKQTVRGWLAEDAGKRRSDNPYPENTSRYLAWDAGWRASRETNP